MDDHLKKYCAEASMKWYGWGSSVGLSIFLLTLSFVALIIRKAICS
ncbi:MAG: hypothetical protein Q8L98_04075 [Chlamydiales bacterium]|nr:hypothetical protein [Chlamydiales bacterium]